MAGSLRRDAPNPLNPATTVGGMPQRAASQSRGPLYRLYSARLRRQLADAALPRHVGMIIDGNRRWARERALETAAHGHRAGAAKMIEFLHWCDALGIRVVTIYLLSTDNLTGRADDELAQACDAALG